MCGLQSISYTHSGFMRYINLYRNNSCYGRLMWHFIFLIHITHFLVAKSASKALAPIIFLLLNIFQEMFGQNSHLRRVYAKSLNDDTSLIFSKCVYQIKGLMSLFPDCITSTADDNIACCIKVNRIKRIFHWKRSLNKYL